MTLHRTTTLVLVLAVLLAGCSGIIGSEDPSETDAETTTEATTTDASTPTETTTSSKDDVWVKPLTPNEPIEEKQESGRISDVRFVDTTDAGSGDGYSDFDLEIDADTAMPSVDPEGGEGEPYFYVEINGVAIERQDVSWEQAEDGTYTVPIPAEAFERFDAGTLEIRVLLLEEDKQYDDLYDTWQGDVKYSP